jgi:hypothetical protein
MVGGPPCQDYSGVNSNREGCEGERGQYMLQFGKLLHEIKKSNEQKKQPLFYLAENVTIGNKKDKAMSRGDLTKIKEAFQIERDPFKFDAKYVSPCKRNRHYFTNIPATGFFGFAFDGPDSIANPNSCLEDGYVHPATFFESDMSFKANCFMASKGRLNDDRMYVYKLNKDGTYQVRPMHLVERERLMGLPEGYVSTPVNVLFDELLTKGFMVENMNEKWQDHLDPKYHHFKGAYHKGREDPPYGLYFTPKANALDPNENITLKMVSADTPKVFLTADEYGKHLVGNGFSVPAVEMFLKPLQDIFQRQSYPQYEYSYKWNNDTAVSTADVDAAAATDSNVAADAATHSNTAVATITDSCSGSSSSSSTLNTYLEDLDGSILV